MNERIESFLMELSKIFQFTKKSCREIFLPPYEFKEIVRQCYEIGWKSMSLIGMTSFIVGIVFTMQSRPSLAKFGATAMIPAMVSIAIVRALAPLVTALISSGKIGSQIGAELSSMKVTEQIDAMEVSGTNPIKFLISTRVVATTIMIPILCFYAAMLGLLGGYFSIAEKDQMSILAYFTQVFGILKFVDLGAMVFRAVTFGFTIGLTSSYVGYYAKNGTQGVGKASNSAVVSSMFLVFIEELLIVQFLSVFN
ncbi:MlaE family ABC transporter permease [Sphingobacterium sp. LRF_L2]|uniref:MlaE family ABC transporter permease n=1 Tax=Sphingobacterium sp. LRF_L2 TaxID=3369421 RepID=UPI003F5F0B68